MLDVTTGKRWIDMTNDERKASAVNTGNLVWAGQFTTNVVPSVLDFRLSLRGPQFRPARSFRRRSDRRCRATSAASSSRPLMEAAPAWPRAYPAREPGGRQHRAR